MTVDERESEFDGARQPRSALARRGRSLLHLLLDQQDVTHLMLERLNRKVTKIMASQEELDGYAQALNAAVDGLRADFDRWVAEHPDVDTSLLRAAVERVTALDAERPAPEPTPEG